MLVLLSRAPEGVAAEARQLARWGARAARGRRADVSTRWTLGHARRQLDGIDVIGCSLWQRAPLARGTGSSCWATPCGPGLPRAPDARCAPLPPGSVARSGRGRDRALEPGAGTERRTVSAPRVPASGRARREESAPAIGSATRARVHRRAAGGAARNRASGTTTVRGHHAGPAPARLSRPARPPALALRTAVAAGGRVIPIAAAGEPAGRA